MDQRVDLPEPEVAGEEQHAALRARARARTRSSPSNSTRRQHLLRRHRAELQQHHQQPAEVREHVAARSPGARASVRTGKRGLAGCAARSRRCAAVDGVERAPEQRPGREHGAHRQRRARRPPPTRRRRTRGDGGMTGGAGQSTVMSRAARSEASSQRRNSAAGSISIVSGSVLDRQRKGPERQQPHEVLLRRHAPRPAPAPRARRQDPVDVALRIRMMIPESASAADDVAAERRAGRSTNRPGWRSRHRQHRQPPCDRASHVRTMRRAEPAHAGGTTGRTIVRRHRTSSSAASTASAATSASGALAQRARRQRPRRVRQILAARRSRDRRRDRAADAEIRRPGRGP